MVGSVEWVKWSGGEESGGRSREWQIVDRFLAHRFPFLNADSVAISVCQRTTTASDQADTIRSHVVSPHSA